LKTKHAAWIIGTGIVLMAIHNRYLTLTDSKGVTWLFLPQIGVMCAMLLTLAYVLMMYKKITLGSKFIWIPMLVIVASIIGSVIANNKDIYDTMSKILFAVFLFALYLASRNLGEELFKPFTVAVILVSISCIVMGLWHQGVKTGGLASPTNYDMATGLLVLGTLVSGYKKIWWLSAIVIVGLFFTGADEAIFACVVLFIMVLVRRDWSRKLLLPVGAIVLTLILCTTFGITQKLYYPTAQKVALAKEATQDTPVATVIEAVVPDVILKPITKELDNILKNSNLNTLVSNMDSKAEILNVATGYRWYGNWSLSPLKPFGYGYNIDEFYVGIQHNVVLIIIEQVGILAAIAWLFVIFYCLIKTKWKYLFVGILALGFFDHFVWSQVGCWYFTMVGVASASTIKSDKIFKGEINGSEIR